MIPKKKNNPPLTPAQKHALHAAFGVLKNAFPGLSERDILEGPLAQQALGDLPPWSELKTHKLTNVMTATRGAFVLCWFKDDNGTTQVVIGERPAAEGTLYNASGGGFANVLAGEQPAENAARELAEELRDDKNAPILSLAPSRFKLVAGGVDNRALAKGGHPTDWYGFTVKLSAAEAKAITQHCQRLAADAAYKEACRKASGGEVANVSIMPLTKAARIPRERFAHPHEQSVIAALAGKQGPSLPFKR